jgi:hypothetical protein
MEFIRNKEESGDTPQDQDEIGLCFVNATIVGHKVVTLVDMDSTHSFIGEWIAKSLCYEIETSTCQYKAINFGVKQVNGLIHSSPVKMGDWFGNLDLVVVLLDDHVVILGQEFFRAAQAVPVISENHLVLLDEARVSSVSMMRKRKLGKKCWASEMSHLYPLFPSLFLTFHCPINLPSYHFHNDTWVSPYYFPLYSF